MFLIVKDQLILILFADDWTQVLFSLVKHFHLSLMRMGNLLFFRILIVATGGIIKIL